MSEPKQNVENPEPKVEEKKNDTQIEPEKEKQMTPPKITSQ